MMWAVGIVRQFGVPVVVAVNRFEGDTDAEVDLLREKALEAGAAGCAPSTAFADGGRGAAELADLVRQAASQPSQFRFLYEDGASIKEKSDALVTKVYNADGASYDPAAERQIRRYEALGWGDLPLCIAKTALSLSHDASRKGVARDYVFPIRDVRASIGAGFLYPLAGTSAPCPAWAGTWPPTASTSTPTATRWACPKDAPNNPGALPVLGPPSLPRSARARNPHPLVSGQKAY